MELIGGHDRWQDDLGLYFAARLFFIIIFIFSALVDFLLSPWVPNRIPKGPEQWLKGRPHSPPKQLSLQSFSLVWLGLKTYEKELSPIKPVLEETVQNVPKKKAIEGHNVFLEEILSLVDAKADGKIWSNGGFQGPKATCSHSQALLVGTKNRVHSLLGHVATFITLLSEYSPWHNNPPSRITTWESTSTCLFEEIHCIIVQKPKRKQNKQKSP